VDGVDGTDGVTRVDGPTVPGAAIPRTGLLHPRYGWGATMWLLFLYFPVQAYRAEPHPPWQTAVLSVVLLVFAGSFVAGFTSKPRHFADGDPARHRVDTWWPVVTLAVAAVAAAVVWGWGSLPGNMIYLAAISAFRLPERTARAALVVSLATVAAVHLGSVVLHRQVGDIGMFYFLVPLAWWGVWSTRRLIEKTVEVERARDEVAALRVTAERERVARDVHDVLGHSLTVVAIKSQLVGRLLEEPAPGPAALDRARTEIAEVEELARGALSDVRATVGGLHAPVLSDELAACRAALRAAGIEHVVRGTVDDVPVAHRQLVAWTVREAVTNVVRHSGASRCLVHLRPGGVTVRDDGVGCSAGAAEGDGHGLAGLRSRVAAAGGTLVVDGSRGIDGRPGTSVEVEVTAP